MIEYADQSSLSTLLQVQGSVLPRSFLYSALPTLLAICLLVIEEEAPKAHQFVDTRDITESAIWSIFTALGFALIRFRMRTAYARFWEGTTLLHQMQGEWFESASCLMAFSSSAKASKGEQVTEFRQTLVRLMSLMHGSALESVKKDQQVSYEVIDLRGLDFRTLEILQESSELYGFHRVEVLLHMIQVLMTHNHELGVLTVAAPILSRVYQTLSRGMVNFINAQKIADTMFPFPFAQLCSWFILFQSLFLPFLVTSIIKDRSWAALATFIPMISLHCLNTTAWELEMPYGDDPNDLPLEQLQKKFNKALLMLLRESADHIPSTCPRTNKNWDSLFYSMWATSEMIEDADSDAKRQFFKIQHLGRNTTKTLGMLIQVKKRRLSEIDLPATHDSSDWLTVTGNSEADGGACMPRRSESDMLSAVGKALSMKTKPTDPQPNTIRGGMQEFKEVVEVKRLSLGGKDLNAVHGGASLADLVDLAGAAVASTTAKAGDRDGDPHPADPAFDGTEYNCNDIRSLPLGGGIPRASAGIALGGARRGKFSV